MTPFRKSREDAGSPRATDGWGNPLPDPPGRLRRKTNRHAIVSLLTGLSGLSLLALGFGISALAQLGRRRLERGKPLAYIGLVTGTGWLVATVIAVAQILPSDAPVNSLGLASAQNYPKPGECFDTFPDHTNQKRDCARPHDAEMVLIYEMPGQEWRGDQEMGRLAIDGCEKRLFARYRTRMPIENGQAHILHPDPVIWAAGDRRIACAIAALGEHKLTAPIGPAPSQVRVVDELQPGDCFTVPSRDEATTTLAACNLAHDAQLTHRFEVPDGPYPGAAAARRQAETGCTTRQDAMFAKERSPVPIQPWYFHPSAETWGQGDRLVLCYLTGKNGRDLTRSVIPD